MIIAGDLFDTAWPSVDIVKEVTGILRELRDHDIPVYVIPGSHDYSPSGKTIIDILEKAGLVENIAKKEMTIDRTGIKLIGMHGRKGALEKEDYLVLDRAKIEAEEGKKIFVFHTLLEEMKPEQFQQIEGMSMALLPKGCGDYAGGHPHFQRAVSFPNYGIIAYPGPTFPNNFKELEELDCGRYIMGDVNDEWKVQYRKIPLRDVQSYIINAEGKTSDQLEAEIRERIKDAANKIVLVRIEGCLREGKGSDMNWKSLHEHFADTYVLLKNTTKLTSKEYESPEVDHNRTIEEIEQQLIGSKKEKTPTLEDGWISQ